MVPALSVATIAGLRQQTVRSKQLGDLSAAYCSSKLLLDMLEDESPRCSDLPNHLYELGLLCIALDKLPEGARHLKRAIDFLNSSNRQEDALILRKAMLILQEIETEFRCAEPQTPARRRSA